ncbi:TPA_asm: restriction alleviation protein, Lar family [Salmonella enterica subsp. enterica serovar Carrau]|nr:restriction alleviation protein, Lar family [Salmonella enterica subsp. enterica serovar Carrau]
MSELKPCPFCGGHAGIFTTDGTEVGTYWYWAECWVCESRTGLYATEEKTAEAWNQRVNHEANLSASQRSNQK